MRDKSKHVTIQFPAADSWVILNPIEQRIKEKIEKIGTPLKDWDIQINYGIKTGCNEAFIIDGKKREELIASSPNSVDIIRPILRGKDIKRYTYNFADKYLIFIPWHFPMHNDQEIKGASKEAEKEFKKQYPAIYNHLLQYKDKLANRNKAETGIRYEWYALQRFGANYSDLFFERKIIYPCIMADEPKFCLDKNGEYFTTAPGNIIAGDNLIYLLNMLCSDLLYFALRKFYMGGGIEGELKTNRLLLLPVMKLVPNCKECLMIKNTYDKSKFHNKINRLVYQLYDITEEEIKFIEKNTFV